MHGLYQCGLYKHGHNNSEGCYSHQGRTDLFYLHAYILCIHACLYCAEFISRLMEACTNISKINKYFKTQCESCPFQVHRIYTMVKECIALLESHRKGISMKRSPHTVQYSAAHTVATLSSAFLSFGKELVHRQKKTDKFMLSLLLKVLCSMEKRLHFLHTHNSLRKKFVQVFFL